ncbi:phage tail protein [Pseudomonas asiatica]|uniref:phage tail protein n=1 Tax=Pseudomonas asiatica TaxID=2219225 RepID=UPI0025A1129B|nr:phage tail protein [Pseudomonas asiatica]MDM9589527.1 phage tail protein [Pseudomonas asiatica]WJM51640.1 phage tail protein [Pseudomonas asiatica]
MAAMFVLSMIAMARMQPKAGKPTAAGLEDFSFPSAAERPIQVLAGTRRISGPNVLWYGDLRNSAIKQVQKGLFSSKKTVVGYRYYMGVQLGICHGPDVLLREIKFGDYVAWSGLSSGGPIAIDKLSLFGGDTNGSGGVSGTLRFYPGSRTQVANEYLAGKVGGDLVSAIRGVSYCVLEGMYIGNSASPQAVSFVASRFPKSPDERYTQYEQIGLDANPAFFIYELITNGLYGADLGYTSIDLDTFLAAAKTLYDEGMGISAVIDSSTTAGDVIDDIKRVIQCSLQTDPRTGALKLKLIRDDYDFDDLPIFNASIVTGVSGFTRGSLDTAINEVKLKYTSIDDDFTERTVIAQNNALRIHKGDSDSQTVQMPMVSSRGLAARIAMREMSSISVPLATCTAECFRVVSDTEVGDVVRLSWPAVGADNLVMRVTGVDLGSPGDSPVRLTLVQDVFGVSMSLYADGSERTWVKPTFEPTDITRFDVVDAPVILTTNKTTGSVLVVAENPGIALDYQLQVRGGVDSGYVDAGVMPFTPLFATSAAMGTGWTDVSLVLSGPSSELSSITADEVRQGLGLMLIVSSAGKEWISYQTAVAGNSTTVTLGLINRGLFNTRPLAHPTGARVWAVSEGHGVTDWQYVKGESVSLRMLPRTQTGVLDVDDAVVRSYSVAGTNVAPWAPGRVRVNGVDGGQISGVATVTWRKREGSLPAVVFYGDDVDQASDVTYQVVVRSGGTVIKTVSGITGNTWRFDDELALNGGAYYSSLTFEISAQKPGFADSASIAVQVSR